ncbi:copper resistance CopC/CopD family protein [Streptomyces sp. NBC_01750]|uniref:copper resistance CopC/CopD family protein n=1 Tax=Streptomyces sp. NBC_01750 TaxID=2975928 RepID=UPI002DDA9ED9|nr:copper resistance protein CopC [Streptomyces sp. NBC_01750]WSD33954.1 copper resistance protein CopC [Streptomyces sp. NBC_01750]
MTATAPRFGPSPVRLLLAATVLIGTLIGALLAGANPASAHAALTGSNPKDGAVVATAPSNVTLTFSEQIAMGNDSIRVLEPSGKRADKAKIRDLGTGGKVMYGVDLLPGLPNGTYTVAWQAVSADSHPVSGAFTFSIGAPSETTAAVPDQEAGGGVVGVLYDIARYASYAGFVLLTGGAAFVLICWRRGASARPLQRLVVQGWVTLTAATLALLLLRNPYTSSGKLADTFDLGGLRDVLQTKTGAALSSRLMLLGAAALFIAVLFGAYAKREDETEKKDLSFGLAIGGTVVAAGIAGTWALSEHASTGIQPGLAMPVDVLHLLAVATWLGGLAALLTALYRAPSIERAAVRNFSKVAFGSVMVLAATGIYQSWRQVGSWSALTGTAYGQLLLAKVALVVVMVAVAWISRRWTAQLGEAPMAEAETDEAEPEPATVPEGADAEEAERAMGSDVSVVSETSKVSADPERAAQLARQKAAVATAEKKRNRDADHERSGLRRSVLAEAGIAVILLAVTTVLTSTEPGRTEEEAAKGGSAQAAATTPQEPTEIKMPFDTGGQNGKGTVRLTFDPATSGANEMHVWIARPDGKPLDVPEVKVAFNLKAKRIGPLPITPDRITAGHWSAAAVQIPMPGDWQVQVTVRTSDIDQTTIDKNIKIG